MSPVEPSPPAAEDPPPRSEPLDLPRPDREAGRRALPDRRRARDGAPSDRKRDVDVGRARADVGGAPEGGGGARADGGGAAKAPAADTRPPVSRPAGGESVLSEADSELRAILRERRGSAMRKYAMLNVGREGLGPLIAYEWRTAVLGSIPGAAGLFLRQKLCRRMWKSCGRGVAIGRNVTVRHPHRIVLGDNVVVDDNAVLDGKGEADVTLTLGDGTIIGRNSVLSCKGGTITLGAGVNVSVNCTLISESRLTVGPRVLIAGHCYLIAGGNHGIDRTDIPIVEQPLVQKGGVSVGENAWLGAGVKVLDGVTIGRDAVVAAGAVVNRSLPDFAIGVGVPARVLRVRQAEDTASDA